MSKFTLPGAAIVALLSAAAATAALAQAANPEPGYCAQFYPNSDCNSIGPATSGSNKQDEAVDNDPVEAAPVSPPAKPAKPKKQAHRSASATTGAKPPKADAAAK
jgi:hypothetical protein